MSDNPEALIQRLNDEADLCRNEGASDIAGLLSEAAAALAQQAATPTAPLTESPPWPEPFVRTDTGHLGLDLAKVVERDAIWSARVAVARQAATPAPAEPVAWRMRDTGYRRPHFRYYDTREQAEQDAAHTLQSRDDGHLTELTPLYAAPPATPAPAEPKRWIPVTERRPDYDETAKVLAWTRDDDYGGVKFHHIPALDFYEVDPDGDGEPGTNLARTVTHWMPEPWPPNDERAAPPATPAAQEEASGEMMPSIATTAVGGRAISGASSSGREPATPAAQPADEREAFEAWVSGTGRKHLLKPHPNLPGYEDGHIHTLWTAWQARAALGSQG